MNHKSIITVAVVIFIISFVVWRSYATQNKNGPAHSVIIVDRSMSVPTMCSYWTGLANQSFSLNGMMENSTLSFFGTGGRDTSNEPISIALYDIPVSRKVMEGKGVVAKIKESILQDIHKHCNNTTASKSSPIKLSVKRGIDHLRGLGCSTNGLCYLHVFTDANETSDPWLKSKLKDKKPKEQNPPVKINNQGVQVVICGLSEHTRQKKRKKT